MENTSFTIIMPVYNTRKNYLEFAINSVLNINYINYELIIVDDGSSDETKKVLNKYKERATIITQKNTGMCKARINAFKYIHNDYVIFMDSDDYIEPESLALLNSIITKHKSDIVLYDFARFRNDDVNHYFNKQKFLSEGVKCKSEVLEQLCRLHLNSICSKIIRKELLTSLEHNINPEIRNGDDLQQSTYLVLKAESFYYTENIIQLYRILDEQRSYYNIQNITRDINWLIEPLKMLKKNNIDNRLYDIYYSSAVNNIIFNVFRICILSKNKEERNALLETISTCDIVTELKTDRKTLPAHLKILFSLFNHKSYSMLSLAAKIYDSLFRIQRI